MSLNREDFELIAKEWLGSIGTSKGFPNSENSLVAFDKICELAETNPEDAWRFIKVGMDLFEKDKFALGQIAAGPFQDILDLHGDLFIDRIEEGVRKDSRILLLVKGIYLSEMSHAVKNRVETILKKY